MLAPFQTGRKVCWSGWHHRQQRRPQPSSQHGRVDVLFVWTKRIRTQQLQGFKVCNLT